MIASVIISARNEYPQICFTVHSILESLGKFLPVGSYEVIIVNNNSNDSKPERRAQGGTSDFLSTRGMYHNGILRVAYYPVASNVGARNYGAKMAKGEFLFFSDAHMVYGEDTFERWIQTIKETKGLVHPAVAWIGSYPPQKGYGYSWKLGEEFKGTWNNYLVGDGKDWFYVPGMGHCSIGMYRRQFLEYGGYIENRCYGGGEMYLDSLFWMMGSCAITEPRINAYHLSSERGYSYDHDDYIHNVFTCALALGADWWAERTFINYLRKGRREVLDSLWQAAIRSAESRRALVREKRKITFDELISQRPWDEKNIEKFGLSNSGMLIFHDTWLKILEDFPEAKKAYDESILQVELEKFINENLSKFVYRRNSSGDILSEESKSTEKDS